ncbi:MAG: XRE family transcriptional regulator [Chloroflexi bacterium]|nr:XRE family transcriptional regulator [Chloroflexota bacterium]
MTGARIKQARLMADLTQKELAEQLTKNGYPVSAAAISKYEKGKSFPPAQFLLLASSELNVRSTYFSHQPVKTVKWKSFRRHSTLAKKKQDAIKGHAADIAELHIELHSLLYPEKSPEFPGPVTVKNCEDAERVASNLRERWNLGNRPLDNLVQTSEDRGVVVISWNKSGKFDGLSGWCGDHPVTVLNTKRTKDRIRFSLAHEIGHLVMNTADLDEKSEESLANRFASAFLVPSDHARRELGNKRDRLDWGELMMLKRKYGLSMAAWVRRAKDLGIISENQYTLMFKDLGIRGWRKQEPIEYLGDEEPLQLKQMSLRAVAEGLTSPDRISSVCPRCLDDAVEEQNSEHLTVQDLLAMSEDERNLIMKRAFALAAEDEFETFEADEFYEFEDLEVDESEDLY